MQLIYSSKVYRPSFSMLSDNVSYYNRFLLQSGNATLRPQTSGSLSLNAMWSFVSAVVSYGRTDNAITTWCTPYTDGNVAPDAGVLITRPVNLNDPVRNLTCYLNFSPSAGIWTMNYTAGVIKQWLNIDMGKQDGLADGKVVSFSENPMYIIQANNSFSFRHDWMAELGMEYHSRGNTGNVYLANNYLDLSLALQKSFLRDKSLVVRLAARDLLGMACSDVVTEFGYAQVSQTNRFDTRRIVLSVNYRFNMSQSKYKGTGAGKETISRGK